MLQTHAYLVPDYYPDFACKLGACRASCCEGWQVSLPMEDYFRLLGLECKRGLREKLDCALCLCEHPTRERYAELKHRFDGDCHLRLSDGRCALHAQLGEDALPHICRLYPRAVRAEGDYECSCANSCEAVVECLLHRDAPLRFERHTLSFELLSPVGASVFKERFPDAQAVRLRLIAIVQNRALPLADRLFDLGGALRALEAAQKDGANPLERLDRLPRPEAPARSALTPEQFARAFAVVRELLRILDAHSRSLHDYGEAAAANFADCADAPERYAQLCARFDARFANWQTGYEGLLANHLFFTRFPFSDDGEALYDEFMAVCALYTLMRFLGVGWTARREGADALADVLAAAFRLVEHTPFHQYAPQILRELNCAEPEQILALTRL